MIFPGFSDSSALKEWGRKHGIFTSLLVHRDEDYFYLCFVIQGVHDFQKVSLYKERVKGLVNPQTWLLFLEEISEEEKCRYLLRYRSHHYTAGLSAFDRAFLSPPQDFSPLGIEEGILDLQGQSTNLSQFLKDLEDG